jgi:hypothetical protein
MYKQCIFSSAMQRAKDTAVRVCRGLISTGMKQVCIPIPYFSEIGDNGYCVGAPQHTRDSKGFDIRADMFSDATWQDSLHHIGSEEHSRSGFCRVVLPKLASLVPPEEALLIIGHGRYLRNIIGCDRLPNCGIALAEIDVATGETIGKPRSPLCIRWIQRTVPMNKVLRQVDADAMADVLAFRSDKPFQYVTAAPAGP